eukprot:maker-scaffold_1-snap-gene-22.62-mRNA-1 protein AED:0.01 eAED:0.01 QI:53/1/1/1/1/1/3/96/431
MAKKKSKRKRTHHPSESHLQSLKAGTRPLLESLKHNPVELNDDKDTKEHENDPRSFVVKIGRVNPNLQTLVSDVRQIMAPYTALKLKERKNSTIKDFLSVSSYFNVSNVLIIGETTEGPTLRISKVGLGPTLTMKIEKYALCKQIRSRQAKRRKKTVPIPPVAFHSSPIVVLNNFPNPEEEFDKDSSKEERAKKITGAMFQGMFPEINIETIKLSDCKRMLLVNYNEEKNCVEIRHFHISIKTRRVNKSLKKVIRVNDLDMSKLEDIGEIFEGSALVGRGNLSDYITSDSELEGTENTLKIAQKKKGLNIQPSQVQNKIDRKIVAKTKEINQLQREEGVKTPTSGVHLQEIGPRLNLSLIKVQDGVFQGEVLYHRYKSKTEAQIEELRRITKEKQELKKARKKEQEENVERKKQKKQKVSFESRESSNKTT